MRFAFLAATAALTALSATAVVGVTSAAAEPRVSVAYGPKLLKKLDEYGARDVDRLSADLRSTVLRQAAGSPALQDADIDLVLEDVVPNRPTIQQMSDKPGLSYESFGIGGATISGTVTTPDGGVRPVSYQWYESDIRWAWPSGTWSDAQRTFQSFAARLAAGDRLQSR